MFFLACLSFVGAAAAAQPWTATVVSGYWKIPSKHSHADYTAWWRNSLRVNAPYVFYYDTEETRTAVQTIRGDLPTKFVQRNLTSAPKFSLAERLAPYAENWTHPIHVPSTAVARIWLAKVTLVAEVALSNPFGTEWFAWADAGLAIYRNAAPPASPWPAAGKLDAAPVNEITYTKSGGGDMHGFAGTAFVYRGSFADEVERLFALAYSECTRRVRGEGDAWKCGSDQIIFTHMLKAHPGMFNSIGEGYGDVIRVLY